MKNPVALLSELQRRLVAGADLTDPTRDCNRLLFLEANGLLHVEAYVTPFDEPFADVLAVLARAEVAERLAVLRFDGPDEGANGTKGWDFSPLADAGVTFPNLVAFRVALTRPDDHNQSILSVGGSYEEEGMVARLMERMPNLRDLTVPSAPDAGFFAIPSRLRRLTLDAGYDHQDFIANLSRSPNLTELAELDFGDVNDWYNADYPASCVPFEQYLALVQSVSFFSVRNFRLRNAPLTPDEIGRLRQGSFKFHWVPPINSRTGP